MDVTPYLEPAPAPRGLFDGLDERADRVRLYAPEPVTYGELAAGVRQAALYLRETGLVPGDRVVVLGHNSVEWAIASLAIQAAGGVMVPIYPSSTADQVRYIVDHCGARTVFAGDPDLARRVDGSAVERVVVLGGTDWDQALARGGDDEVAFRRLLDAVSLDQLGLMLYTSGTTGNPKGVPLTHANVALNARDWLACNAPLLHDQAVDILWLPMSHIFGLGELNLGTTLGFTTHMSDPRGVLDALPSIKPTVFFSVPAYWEKLARAAVATDDPVAEVRRLHGGRLEFCLSGGAGLKRDVKELFHRAGVLIIEGYGLTECAPTLTLNRPDDFRFDSVGKPLPSVELRLADDGEILARGPNVFGGYHRDPQATAAAFTPDGWFKTGDIGRFTDDGFLQIVDRKKDILVTAGGKNVPPVNIELRFCDDPLIDHVVVYGDGKKYLVAGVWPNHAAIADALGPAPSTDSIRGLIAERVDAANAGLARFETIKKFDIMSRPLTVEGGLLTASLKIRRKQIYDTFRAEFEALYEETAP